MTVMAEKSDSPDIVTGGPFTVDDLEAMPDDGRRYELLDGILVVTPAPVYRHQKIIVRLSSLLDSHCPEDMETLVAPFAVRTSESTELQPDVLVKGGDYSVETVVGHEVVLASGGRVEIVPIVEGFSTTGIVRKLQGGAN